MAPIRLRTKGDRQVSIRLGSWGVPRLSGAGLRAVKRILRATGGTGAHSVQNPRASVRPRPGGGECVQGRAKKALAGPAPGSDTIARLARGSFAGRSGNGLCGESLVFRQGWLGGGIGIQLNGARLGGDPENSLLRGKSGRLADFELGDGAHNRPLQLGESRIVRGEVLVLLELLEGRAQNLNKTVRTRKHHFPWMPGGRPEVDREPG